MSSINTLASRRPAHRLTGLALGLALLSGAIAPVAMAGPGHRSGYAAPQTQTAGEQQDLRDDRRDLMRLSAAVNEWHMARARGDYRMEMDADARIQAWLYQEVLENRQEAIEAQGELAVSRAEARYQARQAAYYGQHPGATPGAAAARDDRADAAEKLRDAQITRAIYDELVRNQPYFNARTASRGMAKHRSDTYRKLQAIATAEIAEDREELYEDSTAMVYPARPPQAPPAPPRRW